MHHYLEFNNVKYIYPDGHEALSGVSLRITHGEHVALLGANGAGKSTLQLLSNGLLMASEGEVIVGGVKVRKESLRLIRQSVGLVFQDVDNQLFMSTVEEDVAFGPRNMGLSVEEVNERVGQALRMVGAEHLRGRMSASLSGGEKRRVAIATTLSMTPSILVMDEPTSDLDPRSRRQLIELLRGFDHTLLIATHDMNLAAELCPRVVILNEGKIMADGKSEQIFRCKELLEACSLEQPYARIGVSNGKK